MSDSHKTASVSDSEFSLPGHSIGNDIVDLTLPEPPLHPRYIQRVFAPQEQAHIAQSSEVDLWAIWSAKEAAFKAVRRFHIETVFRPKDFIYDVNTKRVSYRNLSFYCLHQTSAEYVHCTVTTDASMLEVAKIWIGTVETEGSGEDSKSPSMPPSISPSRAVRELAIRELSALLQCSETQLAIPKHKADSGHSRAPVLHKDGTPTGDLISFSHHGRYLACAYYSI